MSEDTETAEATADEGSDAEAADEAGAVDATAPIAEDADADADEETK